MSSITSPSEGYPIAYMTPSPSGSESNSHSHFSPHGAHTEDGAFSSPNIHSHSYHSNLDGFPFSTSSYSSQGHLPHMVSMATQPRGSVEDDGMLQTSFLHPQRFPAPKAFLLISAACVPFTSIPILFRIPWQQVDWALINSLPCIVSSFTKCTKQ